MLGPGLAGILAVWFGARDIFIIDAISFVIAAFLILSIPSKALSTIPSSKTTLHISQLKEVGNGIKLLFSNPNIRFALVIEFVSAIAGAQILVNSIGYVKNFLHLQNSDYGWLMAAFGIGAISVVVNNWSRINDKVMKLFTLTKIPKYILKKILF